MPWNLYRKFLNVLLQNLMRMEHFEMCILKLIKKNNISETNELIELKFFILSIFKIKNIQY